MEVSGMRTAVMLRLPTAAGDGALIKTVRMTATAANEQKRAQRGFAFCRESKEAEGTAVFHIGVWAFEALQQSKKVIETSA